MSLYKNNNDEINQLSAIYAKAIKSSYDSELTLQKSMINDDYNYEEKIDKYLKEKNGYLSQYIEMRTKLFNKYIH